MMPKEKLLCGNDKVFTVHVQIISKEKGEASEYLHNALRDKAIEHVESLGYRNLLGNTSSPPNGTPLMICDQKKKEWYWSLTMLGPVIGVDDFVALRDEELFKPFDRVLVRDSSNQEWSATLYSHLIIDGSTTFVHRCVGGGYKECIPYDENLVGKRTGELISGLLTAQL